jgi:hypothetical protein
MGKDARLFVGEKVGMGIAWVKGTWKRLLTRVM